MNLAEVIDFATQAHDDLGRYRVTNTILAPQHITFDAYAVSHLHWQSVRYQDTDLQKVPDNRKGVYAFTIREDSQVLPPHGYVLYIGAAGITSGRSLRDRYGDYRTPQKILKRSKIAMMIGTWHEVLQFMFAPVDHDFTTAELKELEKQLNTALLPPYSQQDLHATVRRQRRAF